VFKNRLMYALALAVGAIALVMTIVTAQVSGGDAPGNLECDGKDVTQAEFDGISDVHANSPEDALIESQIPEDLGIPRAVLRDVALSTSPAADDEGVEIIRAEDQLAAQHSEIGGVDFLVLEAGRATIRLYVNSAQDGSYYVGGYTACA
jgi:hypothetical protein